MGKLVKVNPRRSTLLIVGCLVHAVLITGVWLLEYKLDLDLVPGKIWFGLALAWPLWFISAFIPPRAMLKQWAIAGILGLIILVPTISTLYTFLVWAIEGFAP